MWKQIKWISKVGVLNQSKVQKYPNLENFNSKFVGRTPRV